MPFSNMANYQIPGTLLTLALTAVPGLCVNLQFEDIHSQSFVPNVIFTSYNIRNADTINFNLTIKQQFPGRLLMHAFVRRLSDPPGGSSIEVIRFKNLDFCKTLESMRNLTTGRLHNGMILPSTFLITCPIMPGFYYIKNGVFNLNMLPTRFDNGRYFVLVELIQIYEEVIKLLNCKIKCRKQSNGESQEGDDDESSSGEENESDMVSSDENEEDEEEGAQQSITEVVTEVEQATATAPAQEATQETAAEATEEAAQEVAEENMSDTENYYEN